MPPVEYRRRSTSPLELTVSVVVITRNQGWNIERLLRSALSATRDLPAEVILVDSASDDGTVERALEYPVQLVRLPSEQRLTAAAGRFVGFSRATGDIVLFLDGDMELLPGWLPLALSVFAETPEVAVVSGQRIDLPKNAEVRTAPSADPEFGLYEDRHGGGAAAYRAEVLREVGPFDPSLISEEEPELCLRIRRAGYRVVRTIPPMVHHYTDEPGALTTMLGRRARGLYLGGGQVLRTHAHSGVALQYLAERGSAFIPIPMMALGAVAGGHDAVTGQTRWLTRWGTLVAVIFGIDVLRRRSLRKAAVKFLERVLLVEGATRGFCLPRVPSESYEASFQVLTGPS